MGYNMNIERQQEMTIKDIRSLTGLSQAAFGREYGIPAATVRKWEAPPDSSNHRECPEYVKRLLERAVRQDFHADAESRQKG